MTTRIPSSPTRRLTGHRVAIVAVVVFTDAALVARSPDAVAWRAGWLAGSFIAYASVLATGRRGDIGHRWVAFGVVATAGLAVTLTPFGSRDMWGYAAYGRTLSAYHDSPYVHVPAEHPDDPITRQMAPGWRHTPAPYGPVFVALAGAGMTVAGDSAAVARAYFQGLAALALVAALVLLRRAGATPVQLALLGLNPLVIVTIVNGGHNDLLVGVAVLGGVLLAMRDRWRLAGLVVGVGACIKIVALVALAAVAARRLGLRVAAGTVAVGVATVVVAYAAAGGRAALSPVVATAAQQSRASVWGVVQRLLSSSGWWPPAVHEPFGSALRRWLPWALAGVAMVWIVLRIRRATGINVAVGAALLAYLAAAPYVLPWYVGWLLPVLALFGFDAVVAAGVALSGVLLLAYANGTGGIAAPALLGLVASPIAPLVEIAVLFVAVRYGAAASSWSSAR